MGETGGQSDELSEVASGGASGDTDALGIEPELRGIGAEEAEGGFAVVDGGGELMLRSEAVGDRRGDVAFFSQPDAEGVVGFTVASSEAAAVNA